MKKIKLLITGGTGSFGNAVLRRYIKTEDFYEIRVFSRDEKKQDDMRKNINDDRIKFYIGDVRDRDSLNAAVKGVDYIFHAAALKQVPSCEFFPIEAIKTNILGTENVLNTCLDHHKSTCHPHGNLKIFSSLITIIKTNLLLDHKI